MSRSFATIVFKSGASIEADVSEISTARNRVSGDLSEVKWTHHDDAKRRILTLNLDNIDAIVFNDGDEVGA